MAQIFPIDFEEKLTMAQDDYILFSDSEDGNKIKKAQYKNLKGEKGDPGTPGADGKDGKDGTDGTAATITVGSTTTGAAGSSASVVNSGTSSAAVLDFTIPQGAKGEPGEDGQDGADGAAATITVGTTTTLPAGSSATVENVGTSQDAILNFGIPKGDQGVGSGDVNGPASSVDGDVAVFDGVTGKAIKDGSVSLATLSAGASAGATAVQPGDIGTAAACNTGTSSGNVPVLDSNGKLATTILPGVALTDTFTVTNKADLTSLSSAEQGDIGIVTSESKTYVLSADPYSTAANWKELLTPTDAVTSVNGQTGAVTIEVPNTKTFYLSSTSDLTTAQAAYDWYLAGNNPIIIYSNQAYIVYMKLSSSIGFNSTKFGGTDDNSGVSSLNVASLSFNLSSNTVTSITSSNKNVGWYFLRTGKNYSTPYTPEYDGSPATKKYVDDKQKTISVTLTTAGWSASTQSVTATGVTASNTVICSPAPSSISDYSDGGVYCSAQGTNSLTFTCDSTPSNDITVNVVILN